VNDVLNLPHFPFDIREEDGKRYIFDKVRRRYVVLTPEEWVRQHFVQFLIEEKNVPQSRIENEQTISLFRTTKRCDTLIYGRNSVPLSIVEYKAPSVRITRRVFEQIGRYNFAFRVKFLMVSNGVQHYVVHCQYGVEKMTFLKGIPSYEEMLKMSEEDDR